MDHRTIARSLVVLLCTLQGILTLAIDLSRTHATNPTWPRHARFHLVWQTCSTAFLSALEIALVCWPGPYLEQRFYLAMGLICVPLLGFLAAFVSRKMYNGALSDPNGIPPARISIFGTIFHIDLNLVAIAAALMALAAIFVIFNR